jgi:deoxyadenosine/deoxycytidine kinase
MHKIAFCGAHGTGKTTLVKILAPELGVYLLERVTRTAWENFGVEDFEKMPRDARTPFQNYLLLNQITREDTEGQNGFITDRSVIDVLGYTLLSSDMQSSALEVFKNLVRERVKNYTHLIYTPVEFEAASERLRANIETRDKFDEIIKKYLLEWLGEGKYLKITGSVEQRLEQIRNFLK